MKRVTGIGGIFFKSKDPKALNEWYRTHLGVETSAYGAQFWWNKQEQSHQDGYTLWNPFPDTTKYFEPSEKEYMINYTVEDLEALVAELRKENVTILDEIAVFEYGKFVHIQDPEGNKIELWQPA